MDRIWNDFTGDPSNLTKLTRDFFTATYAQPGGMRAGFGAVHGGISTDAAENKVFEQVKLSDHACLSCWWGESFGALQAVIMRHVAATYKRQSCRDPVTG